MRVEALPGARGRGALGARAWEVCGFTWTENADSWRMLGKAGLVYAFDLERVGLSHRYDVAARGEG